MELHEKLNRVIHHALRRDWERLAAALAGPVDDERRAALVARIRFMLEELHTHHVREDEGVWPAVLAKRPDLEALLDDMERDHAALASASHALAEATDRWAAAGGDSGRVSVRAAVTELAAVAEPHLQREETETMPLVCQVLTEADWKAIEKEHLQKPPSLAALGTLGMWLLDGLEGELLAALRSQLPRPLVWFLVRRYGPAYRRRGELLWGPGVPVMVG